jgi:hypothetical protein
MLIIEPPIKAAWLGRARSQSCEAFLWKVGHNPPKWEKVEWAAKARETYPHQTLIGAVGFFIWERKTCKSRGNISTFAQSKPWETMGRRASERPESDFKQKYLSPTLAGPPEDNFLLAAFF